MSSELAISVNNVSKAYTIWRDPAARLKHPLLNLAGELFPPLRKKIDAKLHGLCSEFYALNDISFEVKKGESVGIIGRNGSGKSTLLQIIAGTLQPTQGSVTVHGRVAALLELGSGFNPEFTGRENVYLNASILGLTREETDARFTKIAAFADIGDFINQPVKTYSSGMVVRLAFAVIAHVDADVLIVDEALAVGDVFFTQKCMRFIREFIKEHTLIFVSHDTAAVKSICNKALWLDKGTMIQSGTPKEISELYLQAFYEGQQGKGTVTRLKASVQNNDQHQLPLKDARLEWINKTNLRNDIQVFQFDPEAASFGKRGATITQVELLDEGGNRLSWIVGGEEVILQITIACHEKLYAPIVGFHLKDRLGQILFGDNTYLSYQDNPQICEAREKLKAQFHFEMPRLAVGNYSIELGMADGTQSEHIQHHWVYDAIQFKSETTSLTSGLVGIPMKYISLEIIT
ncbi:MAG: ABC transporter ATP-binding protein [Verrucomicrobiae bacterium]|nr:ABC transporter ATP-binding protein [Verrucomicrobiae bacterium]